MPSTAPASLSLVRSNRDRVQLPFRDVFSCLRVCLRVYVCVRVCPRAQEVVGCRMHVEARHGQTQSVLFPADPITRVMVSFSPSRTLCPASTRAVHIIINMLLHKSLFHFVFNKHVMCTYIVYRLRLREPENNVHTVI